jgi:hypothetical protein
MFCIDLQICTAIGMPVEVKVKSNKTFIVKYLMYFEVKNNSSGTIYNYNTK